MKKSTQFNYIIAICTISVLILIIYSLAITYFLADGDCLSDPNTYCYTDWKCYNPNTGEEENVSKKYYLNGNCSLITEETLHNFPYYDLNGEYKVGDPGNEENVWDPDCQNGDKPCSNYKVGGIYFYSCSGTSSSPFFTIAGKKAYPDVKSGV